MRYETIVVGLGGMGSAVAATLARRGVRVLGLEQFGPVHARGASHGLTRMIRRAYFEHPAYVPLLERAYELWDELEVASGKTLRARTGGLFAGRPDTEVVAGTLASAQLYGLEHEVYEPADVRRRFPQFVLRDDEIAVFEAVAGAVFPEATVAAELALAVDAGAELRFGSRVSDWSASAHGVSVTVQGESIQADRLVLCAGPWFNTVARDFGMPLEIERNVQFWFEPRDRAECAPERTPVFGLEREGLSHMFYGFPELGDGVKCAFHGSGIITTPDALDRTVHPGEIEAASAALEGWFPAANGELRDASVCMYSLTPDRHFTIGLHPQEERVVLAGGFSGHGFKFVPMVGELVADLAQGKRPRFDLRLFAPGRLAAPSVM